MKSDSNNFTVRKVYLIHCNGLATLYYGSEEETSIGDDGLFQINVCKLQNMSVFQSKWVTCPY